MKKKINNTLIVPKELQIISVLVCAVLTIGGSAGVITSIISQLQSGQDSLPGWSYLLTYSVAPLALLITVFFLLPKMRFVNRAFLATVMSVTSTAFVGAISTFFGFIYSQLFFDAVSGGPEALAAYNMQAEIVYIALSVIGYAAFLGLVLHWRRQKIWK